MCCFSNYQTRIIKILNCSLITTIAVVVVVVVVVVDLLPFCSSDAQLTEKSVNVTFHTLQCLERKQKEKYIYFIYLVWMRSSAVTETERNTVGTE